MEERFSGNRVDEIRPDAPDLAPYGRYAVGVRTMRFTNPRQYDIAAAEPGAPLAVGDRILTVELWYPAAAEPVAPGSRAYEGVVTRDGTTKATLRGRAIRNAPAEPRGGPFPLVILSHGYPGNRFIMCHLGENLASKGYVVASIDHPDSTYDDLGAFASTLYHRPLDQAFILGALANLNRDGLGTGLEGLIDADRAGLVGYSMGGYGVINAIGGGFSQHIAKSPIAPPELLLVKRQAGNPEYVASLDPRIKAAIAIAPWGWPNGFWNRSGLAAIKTPTFFMAGSADTTVGYSPGVRTIFEYCAGAERYLLTFENAGHNAIAPIPAPGEVVADPGPGAKYWKHYMDPVWDAARSNNIAQHFATAFFGKYLKGDAEAATYLELSERAKEDRGPADRKEQAAQGSPAWKGFSVRNATGLRLERRGPAGE